MTALDLPRDVAHRQRSAFRPARGRGWHLAVAVLGPLVLGYLLLATLIALVTAWVPGSRFAIARVFAAAAPAWLAAHHVPVSIDGAPLGVLPLMPTLLVMGLVARGANRVAWRLGMRSAPEARLVIALVGLTHVLVGVVLALAVTGPGLSVSPPAAALGSGLVSAAAATIGLIGPCRLFPALVGELDDSVRHGVRAGLIGLLGLFAGGIGVVALGLLLSLGAVSRLFEHTAPGVAAGFGLLLLCVSYLPNAAIAGMSFLAGPGFSLGLVDLTVGGLHGGPLPAVPLLAAVPTEPAPWWPAGLVVPGVVGVLVGWWLRRIDEVPQTRLRAAGVAAGVVAVACFVLGELAGGRLGNGPFDPVQLPAGLFAVAAFCWIAVPAGAVAWLAGTRSPRASADPADEAAADPAAGDAAATGQPDAEADAEAGPDAEADAEAGAEVEAEVAADAASVDQAEPDGARPRPATDGAACEGTADAEGTADTEGSVAADADGGAADADVPDQTGERDDVPSGPAAPADTAPADTAPADTAPADSAPADTAPADSDPADTGAFDADAADPAPRAPGQSDAAAAGHRREAVRAAGAPGAADAPAPERHPDAVVAVGPDPADPGDDEDEEAFDALVDAEARRADEPIYRHPGEAAGPPSPRASADSRTPDDHPRRAADR